MCWFQVAVVGYSNQRRFNEDTDVGISFTAGFFVKGVYQVLPSILGIYIKLKKKLLHPFWFYSFLWAAIIDSLLGR